MSGLDPIPTDGFTNPRFPKIYSKLRSIFADVESDYIKRVCITNENKYEGIAEDAILSVFIDFLLIHGQNHLKPAVMPPSVEDQCEYLQGIFPNADPNYLRKFVKKNDNKDEEFELFIRQNLESPDYPTVDEYLAKLKITQQQKQYTCDFKVEKFLELFPDPVKHFESADRKCYRNPVALEFLKSYFNKHKVKIFFS